MLTLLIQRAGSPAALQELLDRHAAVMDAIHLVALLGRLAHLEQRRQRQAIPRAMQPPSQHVLHKGVQLLGNRLHQCQPRQLASGLRVLGTLFASCGELEAQLACALLERLLHRGEGGSALQPLDLAHAAWGWARLQQAPCPPFGGDAAAQHEAWARLARVALPLVPVLNAQALSNTLWAFARVRHADPQLLAAAVKRVRRGGKCSRPKLNLQAQHVANIAWAFARLGVSADAAPAMWRMLGVWVLRQASYMKAQGTATTLWAFATAGHHDPQVTQALLDAAGARLGRLRSQGLANLLWALHLQGWALGPQLLQPLLRQVLFKLDEFKPLGLLMVLLALEDAQTLALRQAKRSGGSSGGGSGATALLAARRSQEAPLQPPLPLQQQPQQRHATAGAAAPPSPLAAPQRALLFRELFRQISVQLPTYSPATLVRTLACLAALHEYEGRTFTRAAQLALAQADAFTPEQACQLLHAFATFQHPCRRLLAALLPGAAAAVASSDSEGVDSSLHRQQLVQLVWAGTEIACDLGSCGSAREASGVHAQAELVQPLWALAQQALDSAQQLDAAQLTLLLSAAARLQPLCAQLEAGVQLPPPSAAGADVVQPSPLHHQTQAQQRPATWSHARLQQLAARLVSAAASRPNLLSAAELPALLHAALLLGGPACCGATLARLADAASDQLGSLEPRALVLMMRCHSSAALLDLRMLDAYAGEAATHLRAFSVQALAQLLGALADAAHVYTHTQLVAAAAQQLHGRLPAAAPCQLAACMVHLQALGYRHDALYLAMARQLAHQPGDCGGAPLAAALVALAHSGSLQGAQHTDVVDALAQRLLESGQLGGLRPGQRQQLQAALAQLAPAQRQGDCGRQCATPAVLER